MKENKLNSIKNISWFLCLLFVLNLIYAIGAIIMSKAAISTDWFIQTTSTVIMSFVLWKLADSTHSAIEDLTYHKQDKPTAERDYEKEVIENYSDHR